MPPKRVERASLITGGIDPGQHGWMTLYDGARPRHSTPLPWLAGAINRPRLLEILTVWKRAGVRLVVVEHQQPFRKQGAVSAFTLGAGFEAILMGLMALGIPHQVLKPTDWKRQMGIPSAAPKTTKSQDKQARERAKREAKKKTKENAIAAAQALAPEFDFRESTRHKSAHDGKAESFLMAVLAYRIQTGATHG